MCGFSDLAREVVRMRTDRSTPKVRAAQAERRTDLHRKFERPRLGGDGPGQGAEPHRRRSALRSGPRRASGRGSRWRSAGRSRLVAPKACRDPSTILQRRSTGAGRSRRLGIRGIEAARPSTRDGGEDSAPARDRLIGLIGGMPLSAWHRRAKPGDQGSHPLGAKRSGAAATCGLTAVRVRRLGWGAKARTS